MRLARRHGWSEGGFAGSAVLALAVCAYACALALHGNGFIAAFVGGLAFGAASGRSGERLVPFVEETGALVSLLVWLAFGAVTVVPALQELTWRTVLYAVLSLTVIRMVPVAIALAGARLGLAQRRVPGLVRSARPGLGGVRADRAGGPGWARARPAVAVISFTVLLSVLAARRDSGAAGPSPRAAGIRRRRFRGRGRDTSAARAPAHPPRALTRPG